MDELKANAPILLHILTSCIPSKNANFQAIICVCSSLIFYSHFRHMNLVQKMISLILYAGRANKQVSSYYTIQHVTTLSHAGIFSIT